MKRRTWLAAGVAAGAAAAGVGWRAGQLRREAAAAAAASAAADGVAAEGLWRMRFTRPAGGELAMASLRGRPLLLNFWATWCPPCVKEMPELDAFHKRFGAAGWQVVGLAVDNPTAVREFLARSPVSYAIGMAGLEGTDLSRRLGNDKGGLPFSIVFSKAGLPVERRLGETPRELLLAWGEKY